MRTVVRLLTATFLVAAPLLTALDAPAGAQTGGPAAVSRPALSPSGLSHAGLSQAGGVRANQAAPHSLTVSIDSMSPSWAKPGKRITVRGTVTNNTGSPVSGLQAAIQTSSNSFTSRSVMESYAAGSASSGYLATNQVGNAYRLPGVVHTGTTVNWSVSFTASSADYPQFGVYPLAAVVSNSSFSPLASERTLLPYWPGSGASPVRASWIWPLIDQSQQGPCPQGLASTVLARNGLATSLQSSGRLGGLLTAGLQWSGQADLTWAVDPALLADAQTMSSPYKAGGNSGCSGTTGEPPSRAAQGWLNTLRTAAAGQPMFVTPYADADTTALAHAGMLTSMKSAYTMGDQLAGQILSRPSLAAGDGTGDGGAPSAAWLPGGPTDKGVLSALNETGKVSTAVLGTDDEPAATPTVSDTPVRGGGTTRMLLADSNLTDVLGSSNAASPAGAQFATEQDFLAETAQIVADEPFGAQPIIIAPPRRWAPSAAVADALLSESVHAPWLRPSKLSSVASAAAQPRRLPFYQPNGDQLSGFYLNFVRSVDSSLNAYQDLLWQPGPAVTRSLQAAMMAAASSAWRRPEEGAGMANLHDVAQYVRKSERKVQIIAGDKYLLAGASGDIAVSVRNGMSQAIQVQVQATRPDVGQLSVGKFDALMTVSAGKTGTVKMPVQASGIETSTLRLQLVTRNGSPLSWTQQPLTVQVTRYGQALIILIIGALGVVVLASGVRWVRRWRNSTAAGSGGTG